MKSNKNRGPTLYFSQFGGERPIPEQFLVAMDRAEERTKVPKDEKLPPLSDEIIEARFDTRYENTNDKQLVVIKKKKGRIGPLLDFRTTAEGMSVQVAATMFRTSDSLFPRAYPSSTQDVAIKDLGNGWSIQEVAISGTYVSGIFVPSALTRDGYTKERLNLIPERFRGLIPTLRTRNVVDGQATIPTLGSGELLRSEEDISAFRKLVEVLTINNINFPVEISDTATITEYGGGLVIITSRITVEGSLAPVEGEGVVSSKVYKLGEGHEVRDTVSRYAGAWPILPFARFDARLQTIVPGTEQVVAKGSTTPGISGAVITEIQKVDGYRENKIITTQPLGDVDAYVRVLYGNTTNVDVPPHLESLNGYIDLSGGPGSYSENGYYTLSGSGGGSGGIQLRGSAQASAAAISELGWVIRIPRTSNIPCIHVLFYVANGTSRAAIVARVNTILGGVVDWPDFRPQPITVLGLGGKININAQVAVSAHDSVVIDYLGVPKFNGSSRSNGIGLSYDSGRMTKTYNIPPTIHGTLTISGDSDLTISYGARGTINGGVTGATSDTGVVFCSSRGVLGILSSAAATTGDNSIPTSGKRVHRLASELDSVYPRTRVLVEVVDFADITP